MVGRRYKRKRKLEFSKKIFIGVRIITILVTLFTLIMIRRTNDLSPFMYLIPTAFAEMGAATGFYFNKVKTENEIKILEGMRGQNGINPESEVSNYE